MVDVGLLSKNHIITPHAHELARLIENGFDQNIFTGTILLKGKVDQIITNHQTISVVGGNAGMTKGGTGDVLAGLIAALYCKNDALTSCLVASDANKKAGDYLFAEVGPYFNASDLVKTLPKILWGNQNK